MLVTWVLIVGVAVNGTVAVAVAYQRKVFPVAGVT